MKKRKITAVVMYSIVVVATMGLLCYQCYTLTNSNIELTEANKNLQAELETLSESSYDKKTVELLEMMIAAADSMNFYHNCIEKIDIISDILDGYLHADHGVWIADAKLLRERENVLKEIANDVDKEMQSGNVYNVIAWIESNYNNYPSDIGYQLGTLNRDFFDTFTTLKNEAHTLYVYYTNDNSDIKSAYYEKYNDAIGLENETSDKAEEIISNIITYCIETLYSDTNGK